MTTAYTIVTILSAAWVGFSAFSLLRGAKFVVEPLVEYGVPRGMWSWLGAAKAAGAAGLAAGLWIPLIGVAAGVGVILYFLGAVVTILRARSYGHVAFPLLYAIPVAVSLGLGFGAGALG